MLIQNVPLLVKSNFRYVSDTSSRHKIPLESPRIPNMTLKREYVYGYNGSCQGILVTDPILRGEFWIWWTWNVEKVEYWLLPKGFTKNTSKLRHMVKNHVKKSLVALFLVCLMFVSTKCWRSYEGESPSAWSRPNPAVHLWNKAGTHCTSSLRRRLCGLQVRDVW